MKTPRETTGSMLGFDLSTPRAVAALSLPDGTSHALYNEHMTEHHSWLMPAVHLLLAEAGLRTAEVEALAVGRGPGSFTGVRTAVVTAKTMAHVLGVPLVAPSSLDVLAGSIDTEGDAVCACLDARRGELYYAFYVVEGGEPVLQGERRVAPPESLIEDCLSFIHTTRRRLSLAGNGMEAYSQVLTEALAGSAHFTSALYPGGQELLVAATRMLARKETTPPLALTPLYLRIPDAGPPAGGCTT